MGRYITCPSQFMNFSEIKLGVGVDDGVIGVCEEEVVSLAVEV